MKRFKAVKIEGDWFVIDRDNPESRCLTKGESDAKECERIWNELHKAKVRLVWS